MSIPGVGPITASVLVADVGDGKQYRCGRGFAASIGLVPRQYSTGAKNNLLGISKRGDKNIRRLLAQRARAYMQRLERQSPRLHPDRFPIDKHTIKHYPQIAMRRTHGGQ